MHFLDEHPDRRRQRVLGNAVRPHNAQHVRLAVAGETHVRNRPRRGSERVELPGLDLDLRAVTEAIDLGGAGGKPFERDIDPPVRVAALILEDRRSPARRHDREVEISVPVEVHRLGVESGGEGPFDTRERARAVVAEERGACAAGEEEIEIAIVVEVEKERDSARLHLHRRQEGPITAVQSHERAGPGRPDEVGPPVRVQVARGDRQETPGPRKPCLFLGQPSSAQVVEEEETAAVRDEDEVRVAVPIEVSRRGKARRDPRRQRAGRRVRPGPVQIVAQEAVAGLRGDE